jgi:hypothetical protein
VTEQYYSEQLYPETVPQDDGSFNVTDLQSAEWTVRKIAEHKRKQADIEAMLAAEIMRLKAWAAKETEGHENSVSYLEGLLLPWYLRQEDTSISLPSGRVRMRKLPDAFVYDNEKVIAWAKVNLPAAVRVTVTEAPDKAAISAHIKATGEMPDGLEIKPQPAKFEVVVK